MTEAKLVRDLKEAKTNTIISLIGLVTAFAMAYGFDKWSELLMRQARVNFTWESYYWFLSISNLVFAGLILVLAWFVCFHANKTRIVPIIYLIVGLLATFAFVIEFTVSPISQMITPGFLLPSSRVVDVSAFATAIGVAGFILSKFNHD
jgi:hypothetical protein